MFSYNQHGIGLSKLFTEIWEWSGGNEPGNFAIKKTVLRPYMLGGGAASSSGSSL